MPHERHKMKPLLYIALSCLSLSVSNHAFAKDADSKIRQDENCFDAGWVSSKLRKLSTLKANKTDTVGVTPSAQYILDDNTQHYPERVFMKDQGEQTEFPITPDGRLIGFEKISGASDEVEFCHYDPKRAGLPFNADGIKLNINTEIQFHNQSGAHSLDEIKDGLKDGRSHYKKIAGALSIVVPKMSHIMIEYEDETLALDFIAMKSGTPLTDTVPVIFCGSPMIKVKDLEDIGADGIIISGGDYTLLPVPGLAAMKRFQGCDDNEG